MPEASPEMHDYFKTLDKGVENCSLLAEQARKKGYDPITTVSIPLAKNMAERVEGLISVAALQLKGSGLSQRITELENQYGS
ncbi:MAG: hypothetical protein WC595_04100, partial [Candidatus Nanoarchaeia archaeon]